MRRAPTKVVLEQRLRFYILPNLSDDECWLWTARRLTCGYGSLGFQKRRRLAHVWAYECWIGQIPEGFQIDHLCRNRRCINPRHLEAVTQRTNILRGTGPTALRANQTHCIRGHLLAGENLRIVRATGYRQCRVCDRLRQNKNIDNIRAGWRRYDELHREERRVAAKQRRHAKKSDTMLGMLA